MKNLFSAFLVFCVLITGFVSLTHAQQGSVNVEISMQETNPVSIATIPLTIEFPDEPVVGFRDSDITVTHSKISDPAFIVDESSGITDYVIKKTLKKTSDNQRYSLELSMNIADVPPGDSIDGIIEVFVDAGKVQSQRRSGVENEKSNVLEIDYQPNCDTEFMRETEFCIDLSEAMGENTVIRAESGLELFGNYVVMIYRYAASILGVIAVLIIVAGGIMISMGGASNEMVNTAKELMMKAVVSLILLFLIGLILKTVNPGFYTTHECEDGIDNDGDAQVDTIDPGCRGYISGSGSYEFYESKADLQCGDGLDNDNDSHIDRDDAGCYRNGIFDPRLDDESQCNNEQKAYDDAIEAHQEAQRLLQKCQDESGTSCATEEAAEQTANAEKFQKELEMQKCKGRSGSGSSSSATSNDCNDGQDNDGDGLIDSQDPGCQKGQETMAYVKPFFELFATTFADVPEDKLFEARKTREDVCGEPERAHTKTQNDVRNCEMQNMGDTMSKESPYHPCADEYQAEQDAKAAIPAKCTGEAEEETAEEDDDGDGVKNEEDKCSDTAQETVVDEYGCSCQQKVSVAGKEYSCKEDSFSKPFCIEKDEEAQCAYYPIFNINIGGTSGKQGYDLDNDEFNVLSALREELKKVTSDLTHNTQQKSNGDVLYRFVRMKKEYQTKDTQESHFYSDVSPELFKIGQKISSQITGVSIDMMDKLSESSEYIFIIMKKSGSSSGGGDEDNMGVLPPKR